MAKDQKAKEAKEYMGDLEDWQRNQYAPYKFVGSKLPFEFKHAGLKGIKLRLIFGAVAIVLLIILAVLVTK